MKKTCALTGHRELAPDFDKNAVYDRLEELILDGCDEFLCGMAEGFDLVALECLISLRQKYRIFITACIPFKDHEKFFHDEKKTHYRVLLGQCDKQTVVSENYFNGCFLRRDRYMVDSCDVLFAYLLRDTGGTAYTVKYALSKKVPVVYL